jgi:RimJ/RimL family protein N-acetyltransferase
MKMSGKPIEGKRLRLRSSDERDIPVLFEWYSDPMLMSVYDGIPFATGTLDEFEEDYLHWLETDVDAGSAGSFIMELLSDRTAIGECSWMLVKRAGPASPNVYQVGGVVGPKELRGQGFGTEALRLLRDHLFKDLGAHRLEAMTSAFNGGAMKTLHRNGFVREGVLREAVLIDKIWHDRILFSLLRKEWEAGAVPQRDFPHD